MRPWKNCDDRASIQGEYRIEHPGCVTIDVERQTAQIAIANVSEENVQILTEEHEKK